MDRLVTEKESKAPLEGKTVLVLWVTLVLLDSYTFGRRTNKVFSSELCPEPLYLIIPPLLLTTTATYSFKISLLLDRRGWIIISFSLSNAREFELTTSVHQLSRLCSLLSIRPCFCALSSTLWVYISWERISSNSLRVVIPLGSAALTITRRRRRL